MPSQENSVVPKPLTPRSYTRADLLTEKKERRQALQGFDSHYGDLVDYILRSTYRIWEEKNIGLIYTHYGKKCQVYTPLEFIGEVEEVVKATIATQQAFPDRQLFALNVLWGGDDKKGYYSSHLIRSSATNLGDSAFGPASGKAVEVYTIADCFCYENRVIKEWLVRDNGGYVRQLGYAVEEVAERLAEEAFLKNEVMWFEKETSTRLASPEKSLFVLPRETKQTTGPLTKEEAEARVCSMLKEVWGGKYLGRVDDYYYYNAEVHTVSGLGVCGTPNLKKLLLHCFASFENTDFKIEHSQSNHSEAGENEKFVHVRWSLCGRHAGPGLLGKGTGAPLHLLGISQFRVLGGRIAEEWLLFDELALWKQIKLHGLRKKKHSSGE